MFEPQIKVYFNLWFELNMVIHNFQNTTIELFSDQILFNII